LATTLAQILPLAIGATISPSGLLFVMLILSGKGEDTKKSALKFILGALMFLVCLGLLILFLYRPAINSASSPSRLSAILNIVLGTLIALMILRSTFFKNKAKTTSRKKRNLPYFVLGFAYMLTNVSTLIPFIAAVKIIADDGLAGLDNLALFAIVLIITMMLVSFPVIVTYLMPNKSARILVPVEAFMSKHGSQIARAYFFLIAIYLIVHGIRGLQAA
jgi:hypothetical protein